MGVATGTAIAAASLYAGLKTGVTQGVLKGDKEAVAAGLSNLSQGNINKPNAGLPQQEFNLKKTQVMPTPNQDKVKKSRLNALQSLQQRSGRASTLLTSQSPQNNTFG